jgi:hypothetical protein
MNEPELKIEELQAENQQLRIVLASLSAALLRQVAPDTVTPQPQETANAKRLLHEAEECFRCARIPQLQSAIAEGLEAAGRELMAKAVDIEAALQRNRRKT